MKRKIITVLFTLCVLMGLLAGCSNNQPAPDQGNTSVPTQEHTCEHVWQNATCTEQKICTLCGAKEDQPLGHDFGAWHANGDGTHSRSCVRDDSHVESAACFDGKTPEEGQQCACGYVYSKLHEHTYDQKIVKSNYKAGDATCTHGTGYYYSCQCGIAGTEVFYTDDALEHKEIIDPAKHATFSAAGLTEGSHCSVCGTVIKAQIKIPALGSDMVVGTDYYDKTGQVTYRYSYSFTLYENDRFNLTTLKVGSDESYKLSGEEGKLNYLDNGVYELIFDSGKDRMYGKFEGDQFRFCNKDGSKWDDQNERPQSSVQTPISPRLGNSVYGYQALSGQAHSKSMQELYYRLYAACEAFVDNKQNIKATGGAYTIDRINLDYYVLTAEEAVAVWKVFYMENPRYYWLSNTLKLEGGVLCVTIDPAYATASYRNKCDTAINKLADACAKKLNTGMNQLQKAMAIHDFILGQMDYAYKSDGKTPQDAIWAHNMIGCAEKKSGVCESYAKTYQYLCRRNGLECIVVTGVNGTKHAWNMVKLDGKWYGVDCTFDETNKDTVSYSCFGMDAQRMKNEYTADKPTGSGINYLYALPALAEQGIELVDLYKNNSKVGVYANVDAALAAITDPGADYEIRLYRYETRGVLLLSSAVVEHHINASQIPAAKSITIRGNHIDLADGAYSTRSMLWINKKLSTDSDLIIYDLNIDGQGTLNLKGNKLTCLGVWNQIDVPIKGNTGAKDPSEIVVDVVECTEFWNNVEVCNFYCGIDEMFTYNVVLRANSHIVNLYTDCVFIYDPRDAGICINIDNLYPQRDVEGWERDLQIQGAAVVNVNNVIGTDRDYAAIECTFANNSSIPKVTVKDSACKLHLYLHGETTTVTTDVNGNVVHTETKTMDYSTLDRPVMYLGNSACFDDMEIGIYTFDGIAGYYKQQKDKFTLNSKNQIVWKENK